MASRSKVVALVAAVGVTGGLLLFPTAASAGQASVARLNVKKARLDWSQPKTAAQAAAATNAFNAAATPVQDFTKTIVDGTRSIKYTMIGKDPFVTQANPVTTIKTYLQPVEIKFANGDKWDPTVGDPSPNAGCDATSALTLTQNSPLFKAKPHSFGGTSVGTTQYVDAFQRAGFYQQTKPTGINPGYHVKLTLVNLPKITVNVPLADEAEGSTGCGNLKLGGVEINYWDNLVQNTLLPNMAAQGLTLKDFPFFLFDNVVMYDTVPSNCCILGYHGSKGSGLTFQSYGNGMYDNTGGDFTGGGNVSADISALSHEIGEWMDDPNGVNPTKAWGHIGQVSGCQSNLEVGDPLSGKVINDALGGKTYHPQEMAFYSWFYHQTPSQGINNWFSNKGTFTTAAAPCP